MDWSSLIKSVAPWIGTALAGPPGALVGMAASAAADALGLSDRTVEAVKTALSGATPEQMLALKQADQAFALQMQALGFKNVAELEAIAAGDRKSARDMNIAKPSPVPALLSIGVTLGYFGVLIAVGAKVLPSDNSSFIQMLGSLATGWGMVMAFWFGTTRDSSRKTEMLAKAGPVDA